ncbi:MAG TPA: beta-phosphoglucomutase [Bacteroidetes bacterium]|nr:beta-phosphoglucomutase [Bacteroidota bacterium]
MSNKIKLCIFDLDGVIVDTAKYHYLAWKELAKEFGYDLTKQQNEKLKGVSRVQSLKLILQWAGVEKTEEEQKILAAKKNEQYVKLIQSITPDDVFPGVKEFIAELKENNILTSIGSASKNTRLILEKLEITDMFDYIVDGTMTTHSKPHPEVFLKSCEALDIPPKNTVVFEDAPKGIEAALAGGMYALGVGNPAELSNANMVIQGFEGFGLKDLKI